MQIGQGKNRTIDLLLESKRIDTTLPIIDQSLKILQGKRITLEEKMIAHYLKQLASELQFFRGMFCDLSANDRDCELLRAIEEWRSLSKRIYMTVANFLKMAQYDPNYLEQYWEHDFYSKLIDEDQYLEKLGAIKDCFQALRTKALEGP